MICSYCIAIQGKKKYSVIALSTCSYTKYVNHYKAIKTPYFLSSSFFSSLVSLSSSTGIRQTEVCIKGY